MTEDAEPDWSLFGWTDFECETSYNPGGDPETYHLFIYQPDGEELCTITHRTCGDMYPLDGELADRKRALADDIVTAMNHYYNSKE